MRLAIERNIYEMCPKRKPESRMHHENLDVRGVGTTRPLRRVALFDETCDLTDEEAQEATVRACSANPGIIILGIPRTASKSFGTMYDLVLHVRVHYTFFRSSESDFPSDSVSTVTLRMLPLLLSFTSTPLSFASCCARSNASVNASSTCCRSPDAA